MLPFTNMTSFNELRLFCRMFYIGGSCIWLLDLILSGLETLNVCSHCSHFSWVSSECPWTCFSLIESNFLSWWTTNVWDKSVLTSWRRILSSVKTIELFRLPFWLSADDPLLNDERCKQLLRKSLGVDVGDWLAPVDCDSFRDIKLLRLFGEDGGVGVSDPICPLCS